MNTLLTYDVSAKHVDVKAKLVGAGFMDSWDGGGTTYYLPNTTLWSNKHTPEQAKVAIENVAKTLNVRLERAMAVELTANWKGIPGDRHSR